MSELVDVIEGRPFPRTEVVACPLCGQPGASRRIRARYGMAAHVAECAGCRIAFQTPRPSLEASLAYMNWRWRSADAYVADPARQKRRAAKQLAFIDQCLDPAADRARLRLVDFGAGAGSFVRAARDRGWEASGIEHSDSAIARAREYYDVELRKAFADERYAVATMWDVIEHLRDLPATLALLRDHLDERGLLFVETGNYEGWRRLAEQDRWNLYLFDHHYYFTPPSLERTLARAGFGEFRLLGRRARPNPFGFFQNPARAWRSWKAWRRAITQWPGHGDINLMIAVARKAPGSPDG